MQLTTAQVLVKAAEERGREGLTLRPNYSGRGMYGRTTVGIVLPRATTLISLAAHVVAEMSDRLEGLAPGARESQRLRIDSFIRELERLHTDDCGYDVIVY